MRRLSPEEVQHAVVDFEAGDYYESSDPRLLDLEWFEHSSFSTKRLQGELDLSFTRREAISWLLNDCEPGTWEWLEKDILSGGVQVPLLVAMLPNGRLELGDGWHRFAIAVKHGIPAVPVKIGKLHPRRNPDPRSRELERVALEGGPEEVLAWGNALLRSGQLQDPADRNAVGAANLLRDRGWYLVHSPQGFALQRQLPFNYTITVSNDPGRLGYAGHAVGWGETPLVHFRTEGGGGVLHPEVIGRGMGGPAAVAEAAEFLEKPGARLLGAVTLAADEGRVARVSGAGWEDVLESGQAHEDGQLRTGLLSAAGLWPRPFDLRSPQVSVAAINEAAANAIHYLDEALIHSYDRLIYPVNSFRGFEWVPFPEVLSQFGFRDESWGNDNAARAAREVGGPERGSSPAFPWLSWGGEWPELAEEEDNYELTVWCHGLHPDDSDDWPRYDVQLGSSARDTDPVEIGQADNEKMLGIILADLGLKQV